MTPALVAYLRSHPDLLLRAAEAAPRESDFLKAFDRLSKRYPAEAVKSAIETVVLRRKAATKFSRAERMFFTREALEQATAEPVARHRAARIPAGIPVVDLCCGIGGDALALAENHTVTAVDVDAGRLAMAEANVAVYDRILTSVCADVLTVPIAPESAVFIDPDRRIDGKRRLKPDDYAPPLTTMLARFSDETNIAVKIAPGVDWNDLERYPEAECAFTSLAGELRECCLWFGPWHGKRRRAIALPSGAVFESDVEVELPDMIEPGRILYDPDPAATRAGLLGLVAEQLGASPIAPGIAFLTADDYRPSPWADAYRIEESYPFGQRLLVSRMRELGVGRVTVVQRGSGLEADAITRLLRSKAEGHRQLILTRVNGQPWMMWGERLTGNVGVS